MNTLPIIITATAISLATSAYAASESAQSKATMERKDNGGYESTVKSEETTSAGTAKTSESKGNVEKTVSTEATADPKGLMNKKTDTSETNIEDKANGGYKQTTIRRHTDAEGTNTTYKTVTDVSVDNNGNVTSTATTEKTVDPKGLMNEKTTTSKTKTVNGKVVESSKKND
jgi:hypothetical protein